jgi:hypothetical protein
VLNANPSIERKQNRRKIRTFRRVAEITGRQIEYSGNALLFFLQRENDELAPDLLHKNLGEYLKIHSIRCAGKSQTNGRKVFLNETLFEEMLFQYETVQQ